MIYITSKASPIGRSAPRICDGSSVNKVFVSDLKICGNARSTRLMIAAQIRSRKILSCTAHNILQIFSVYASLSFVQCPDSPFYHTLPPCPQNHILLYQESFVISTLFSNYFGNFPSFIFLFCCFYAMIGEIVMRVTYLLHLKGVFL